MKKLRPNLHRFSFFPAFITVSKKHSFAFFPPNENDQFLPFTFFEPIIFLSQVFNRQNKHYEKNCLFEKHVAAAQTAAYEKDIIHHVVISAFHGKCFCTKYGEGQNCE
jgi:hypothetical protein